MSLPCVLAAEWAQPVCLNFYNKVLEFIVDISTLLIGVEGTRLLENAIAFSSCVGRFEDVIQCPAGGRGRGDPTGASAPRRLPEPPAESEVPGTEITAISD
ncbi:hypothetical protein SAMN05443253_105183 [Bacillus sp. OK048]|nr:hypothetical protein SAMN05443253_105183 [Bacillus sp. OK048]